MKNGYIIVTFVIMFVLSFPATANRAAFWDTLNANRASYTTNSNNYRPRTQWAEPRRSRMQHYDSGRQGYNSYSQKKNRVQWAASVSVAEPLYKKDPRYP